MWCSIIYILRTENTTHEHTGTTRTGYEGKGFEFGKNQAGRDLGTSTSLDTGDGKNNVGPFAMGT